MSGYKAKYKKSAPKTFPHRIVGGITNYMRIEHFLSLVASHLEVIDFKQFDEYDANELKHYVRSAWDLIEEDDEVPPCECAEVCDACHRKLVRNRHD